MLIGVLVACVVRKRRSGPSAHKSEMRTDPAAEAPEQNGSSDDERSPYPSLSKTMSSTSIYTAAPPPVELKQMADYNLAPAPKQNYDYSAAIQSDKSITYDALVTNTVPAEGYRAVAANQAAPSVTYESLPGSDTYTSLAANAKSNDGYTAAP